MKAKNDAQLILSHEYNVIYIHNLNHKNVSTQKCKST